MEAHSLVVKVLYDLDYDMHVVIDVIHHCYGFVTENKF